MFYIFILILNFLMPIKEKEIAEPIFIIKTEQGFNIHSFDEELLLEFTNTNSDSISLDLLEQIYEDAKHYRKENSKNNIEVDEGLKKS